MMEVLDLTKMSRATINPIWDPETKKTSEETYEEKISKGRWPFFFVLLMTVDPKSFIKRQAL